MDETVEQRPEKTQTKKGGTRKARTQRRKGRKTCEKHHTSKLVEKHDSPFFRHCWKSMMWSIFRLWFARWIHATVLVHDARCLFQNAPSQLTYMRFTMKSGSNRLPRRAGLCVLLHADQFLIVSVSPRSKGWISRWVCWRLVGGYVSLETVELLGLVSDVIVEVPWWSSGDRSGQLWLRW